MYEELDDTKRDSGFALAVGLLVASITQCGIRWRNINYCLRAAGPLMPLSESEPKKNE